MVAPSYHLQPVLDEALGSPASITRFKRLMLMAEAVTIGNGAERASSR
jgi:hypothetical protein